jgi:hypothetical protein
VSNQSSLELVVANRLERAGVSFDNEFKFHPTRRWRADFIVFPNILIEVEGGLNKPNSGHRSYTGIHRDIEKQNEAVAMGFKPVRVTVEDLEGRNRWLEVVLILLGRQPPESLFPK